MRRFVLWLPLWTLFIGNASGANNVRETTARIGEMLTALKNALQISNNIRVRIVESNHLGMSVEPTDPQKNSFLLSVDGGFVSGLDDEELAAALSHELGHVWIYTHHPFIHTESLANKIAARAVTPAALKKLYAKVWVFEGANGSMDQLLDSRLSLR